MLGDAEVNVRSVAAGVALVWYAFMLAISLLGCIAGRRRYRSRPTVELENAPGVSILRPLKGLDTNLYENLESTFKQDYPNYEILFSVADEDDEALGVVHSLIARYPHIKATIITGEEVVGVNPKVNNLMKSYRRAENDILWVIDSGISVGQGTLARSVAALTVPARRRIAVVHHVPSAIIDGNQVGSRLEAAFLNTNHAKMYIAINTLGIESCVVGKSNLYRKSDVDRVNGSRIPIKDQKDSEAREYGLRAFGKYLAEDNMLASALWHELDLRHDLSCDVVQNFVGKMSFMDYIWRRVRWIRVRKHMVWSATVLEPFTECFMVALIGSFAFGTLFSVPRWIFLLLHFVAWLEIDFEVYSALLGEYPALEDLPLFLLAWIGRETLAFPIWVLGVFGNEIIWRGQRYQMIKDGEARPIGGKEEPLLRSFPP